MRAHVPALVSVALALVLAACGGGGDDGVATPDAAAGGESTLSVVGTNALAFEPNQLSTSAGEITIEFTAEQDVRHTFVIEGVNSDEPIVDAAAGETTTGTVTLDPGSYIFYCDVPGHRAAGMEGALEVQ